MKLVKIVALLIGLTLLSVVINSCKKEQTKINPESIKNIVGTWKIVNVTRNGVDITQYFDFSLFSIEFKENGDYVISNQVPFIVLKNGTWSLDDPTHPLHISFKQIGASQVFTNEFDYPVVTGVRRIVLKGAPGCSSNTYQYSLAAAQ